MEAGAAVFADFIDDVYALEAWVLKFNLNGLMQAFGFDKYFGKLGKVLFDCKLDLLHIRINLSTTTVRIRNLDNSGIAHEIAPGLLFDMRGLDLWEVIRADQLTIEMVPNKGVTGIAVMYPFHIGNVFSIGDYRGGKCSHDHGPVLDIALTTKSQHLIAEGCTKFLGAELDAWLQVGVSGLKANFTLDLWHKFKLEAGVTIVTKPPSAEIYAGFKGDIVQMIIDAIKDAIKAMAQVLHKEFETLKAAADKARRFLAEKQHAMDMARKKFDDGVGKVIRRVESARSKVDHLSHKCSSIHTSVRGFWLSYLIKGAITPCSTHSDMYPLPVI